MGPDTKRSYPDKWRSDVAHAEYRKISLALTVLHEVEKGSFPWIRNYSSKKEELLEDTWSPFKEKIPARQYYNNFRRSSEMDGFL